MRRQCENNTASPPIITRSFVVSKKEGEVLPDSSELFAIPDFVIGVENIELKGDVSTNDFMFPDDTMQLVYRVTGEALPGLIFHPDGSFVYTPEENSYGKFHFSYELCFLNGNGECSTAEAEIRILSSLPSETRG